MYNNQFYPYYQQTQTGGFVPVRGEQEAREYPVAPGNSVTFKDELAPYVYTKTMGFSQLETPRFERYRLVREEITVQEPKPSNSGEFALRTEFEALAAEVQTIKEAISKEEA